MGYDHGRFVWLELMTDDRQSATRFYSEVLGWKTDQMEMGEGRTYDMFATTEGPVAGGTDLPREGIPPHWVGYVSVADVDATATKVVENGGTSLMDAMDIPGVGRVRPVADPEGSAFFLFTAAEGDRDASEGAGNVHWYELWAKDPAAMTSFYEKVFGYTHETMDMPEGEYFILKDGDASRGGVMASPVEAPSHWTQYIHVDDVDGTLARAGNQGGKALGEAMDVPGVGRFAMLADPSGASIGVITPAA